MDLKTVTKTSCATSSASVAVAEHAVERLKTLSW